VITSPTATVPPSEGAGEGGVTPPNFVLSSFRISL